MHKKKILIIGGAGYIGGYLTDVLSLQYDVTVYDSLLYEDRYLKDVAFIRGDIRDTAKLASVINDYDVLVVLAAMVGDGACQTEPFIAKHINEIATNWITDNYTRSNGKIVFTSTCSVYGKNDNIIDEIATPNPLSVYGETKLAAEQYLISKRPDSLVFRLGTLYGQGDSHSRPRFDLVGNILSLKAALGEQLKVFGGEQWRPLLHVRDVTTAIEYGVLHNLSGLYNLSAGNYTIKNLAEEIVSHTPASKVSIVYTEMPFEDLRNYKVHNQKILSTGWSPIWTLHEGIQQIVDLVDQQRIRNYHDPVYSCESYLRQKYER